MKKMKEINLIIAMTAFLCLGFFAGCTDILSGSAGTSQALIRLGPREEGARTLMPAYGDFETLSYTFSAEGRESVSGKITQEEEPVALAAGTWNLTVEGANSEGVPVLEGIVQDIEIREGTTSPVTVPLKVKTGDGTGGILHYSVSFPGTVIRGSLTVYRWEDNRKEGNPADLVSGALSGAPSESGRITAEDTLSLPAGYYRIALELYHAEGFFSRTEIAHIYGGMTTEYSLTADDFTPAAVEEKTSLADVLSTISGLAEGENKTYLLPAGNELLDEEVAANSNGPVTVTIDGGGRVFSMDWSWFTVGNNISLVLKNVTFTDDDYAPFSLVRVYGTLKTGTGVFITGRQKHGVEVCEGGTFIMNGGKISGNSQDYDYGASGGGVYVYDRGTFIMNGGEISGNSVSCASAWRQASGGGVYVSGGGTFTMNGGKISGNSASSHSTSYGGGVHVSGGGTFTMNGGEISGNSVFSQASPYNSRSSSGGGVYVSENGTFTMKGGKISGNSASTDAYSNRGQDARSYGGGVYVSSNGTFTMQGGEISGNSVFSQAIFANSSSYGGGVYVSESGTFTMQGGEISGNSVFSQGAGLISASSYGGGVYISESGTFTKQPGAVIYGADAGSTLKNAVKAEQGTGDGHAVYISETKRRNSTAGTEVTLDSSIDGTAGGWEEPPSSEP